MIASVVWCGCSWCVQAEKNGSCSQKSFRTTHDVIQSTNRRAPEFELYWSIDGDSAVVQYPLVAKTLRPWIDMESSDVI